MKKAKLIAASLLASSLLLAGCGKAEPCNHSDANNDHLCDTCNEKVSECADANNDHLCDVCGEKVSECADANNDHLCDVCGEKLTEHKDENSDHLCDVCGEALPYVAGVTISGAPETLGALNKVTLTANIDARNGASANVLWSANNSNVSLMDNGDGTVTVIGRIAGTTTITVSSTFDETVTASVELEVLNWTDDELQMMEDFFGETLPYFEGGFTWTDAYVELYDCLTAEATDPESLLIAAEAFEAAGWTVVDNENGTFDIEYFSEITDGILFVGSIYIYAETTPSVDIYAYEYDFAEWPGDEIDAMMAFEDENPEHVPEFEATAYLLQESSYEDITVEIYGLGNCDLIEYFYALVDDGWGYSTAYYSSYGVLLVQSPRGSIELDIYPDYGEVDVIVLGEPTPLITEWPAETIAEALTGYTTTLPEAEGESFAVTVGEAGDFYDLQIIVSGGSSEDYLDVLEAAGFTITLDEVNECYVAEKDGMLIDIYTLNETKFAICVYQKGVWPTEELGAAVENLLGESLEIPSFTADYYEISDYSDWGFVGLTSSNSESLDAYLTTLENAGWTIKEIEEGSYEVYSPAENCAMTVEFDSSKNGIVLSIYTYAPVSTEWPTNDVAAQVTALGAEGTAVPALTGEGVEGYVVLEPGMGYGPVVQVNCATSKTATLLANYIAQLEEAGYFVCGSNYGDPIYALDGETLGISPYRNAADSIYIELILLDEPAVRPSPTPEAEWPVDDIAAFAEKYGATGIVPEYEGEYISAAYNDEDYFYETVEVEVESGTQEAACAAYIAQLEEAGYFVAVTYGEYDYYAVEGTTLALCPYSSGAGYFLIELLVLESPAVKPTVVSEFPADAVSAALGGEKSYPIPSGTGFVTSNPYGESDVVIDITGGDRAAYIQALLDAGFVYDDYMSYSNYSAYDAPTGDFIIYVYDSESNANYQIEFGPYYGW